MNYTLNEGKKSEVTLTVQFAHDELAKKLEPAAAKVSEHVEIKGFRKGKAPLDKVIQHAGEMVVYEHAAEMLVQSSYTKILLDEKIEPLTQPKISFTKLAPNNDFEYTATFIRIPKVTLGDITSITVDDVHVHIQDTDVEKVVNDLKEYVAAEVLVDRESKMGDLLEIDFEGFRDGVPFEGGGASKYKLLLGKGQMIPGFEEGAVGMKAQEEKEITVTFPKDYHAKNLAGEKVVFKIKAHGVYERTLPQSDDAFAKLHGKETFNDLVKAIKHNLQHEEEAKQNQRIELEIIEALIKKSTFGDIHDSLVNQEVEKMLGELKQQIMQQGMQFTDYLTHLKKSEEELRIDMAPQALERVKAALITRAIFIENDMKVTDEELETELQKYLSHYKDPQMQEMLRNDQYKEMIRNVIGNSKVMQFLKSKVTLKQSEHKH